MKTIHRISHTSPRTQRWVLQQRKVAAGHFVRGVSYGLGITLTGLFGFWLQQFL